MVADGTLITVSVTLLLVAFGIVFSYGQRVQSLARIEHDARQWSQLIPVLKEQVKDLREAVRELRNERRNTPRAGSIRAAPPSSESG